MNQLDGVCLEASRSAPDRVIAVSHEAASSGFDSVTVSDDSRRTRVG